MESFIAKIKTNEFVTLTKEQFITCVYHFNTSKLFIDSYNRSDWEMFNYDFEYQIYLGDIEKTTPILIENTNLLIVGNIKTPWLSNATEGGALIVSGNIVCDYYNHCWKKIGFINGDLTVNKLLITAFSDATLVVFGNLKTNFFYGRDIWIDVSGKAEIQYGLGYCMDLNYSKTKKIFRPKHNEKESLAYLQITKDISELEVFYFLQIIQETHPLNTNKIYKITPKA